MRNRHMGRLRPLKQKPVSIVKKPVCVDSSPILVAQKACQKPFVCRKCQSRLFLEEYGVRFCANCNRPKYQNGYDCSVEEPARFDHEPTSTPPGSAEKIEILRQRVALGQPLWHRDDRNDYRGVAGGIKPSKEDRGRTS